MTAERPERTPSDQSRERAPLDADEPPAVRVSSTSDPERPIGLDGDPGRPRGGQVGMAFVVILTCVVVLFGALIAVWMYWLGGQLPGASMPVS